MSLRWTTCELNDGRQNGRKREGEDDKKGYGEDEQEIGMSNDGEIEIRIIILWRSRILEVWGKKR